MSAPGRTAVRRKRWLAAALLAFLPATAVAHSFIQPYTLPVPLALYGWGAGATLALSFVLICIFVGAPRLASASAAPPSETTSPPPSWKIARTVSLILLLLAIATGLFGTQNPLANFNMTFFWVIFLLAVPYATAITGNFYPAINPWHGLIDLIGLLRRKPFVARYAWPRWLGCYPAFALYMMLIWLELFGHLSPFGLSIALLIYSGVMIGGAWLWGAEAWFRHCDVFAVMLRLIGSMAPRQDGGWRMPLAGLARYRADEPGLPFFILFMLSSTAFDGLHATLPWAGLFWKTVYPALVPMLDRLSSIDRYAAAARFYFVWQWAMLFASPFIYLAVFAVVMRVMQPLLGPSRPLADLIARFVPSIIPIAFVYHVTHYYTLLLYQALQILRILSDPFGFGWNLLGTARFIIPPIMIDMETVWHTQVGLILAGHIAGVWIAHITALNLFGTRQRAAISQLPMLGLMIGLTIAGLWILSLPLADA